MKNRLLLLFIVFILFSAFRADKPVLTIFTIGDSTMANKNLYGGNPERGWCMVLPGFFSEDIRVDNHTVRLLVVKHGTNVVLGQFRIEFC